MTDHITNAAEFPPDLHVARLPEQEIDSSWLLKLALDALAYHHDNLFTALRLFDYCEANHGTIDEDTRRWQMIAARDGALTIYHFGETMGGIRSALHKCPTIASWVDSQKLRTETKRFESYFPNLELMRHALAHHAELMKSENAFNANAFHGDYSTPEITLTKTQGAMIVNNLHGRKFVTTISGEIVSYELSKKTCDFLLSIKIGFFDGFREAERQSKAIPLKNK